MRPSLKFWWVELAIAALFTAVIVLLAGIVVPKVVGRSDNTRRAAAQADIAALRTALDAFRPDTGRYPVGSYFLQLLLRQQPGDTNRLGPYLDGEHIPKDSWGHDYVYECPGRRNTSSFDLFSVGPDGRAGTDDDIVNWKK